MIHTWNEDDGAEKVAAVLNDGVKSRLDHITIPEVEALRPLVKKYGRYEVVEPDKKFKAEKLPQKQDVKNNETVTPQMSAPDFTNQPIPTFGQTNACQNSPQ